MNKLHGAEFQAKCREEGMMGREHDDSDGEDSDTEFTPQLLAERLAEWAAVDDQVRQPTHYVDLESTDYSKSRR